MNKYQRRLDNFVRLQGQNYTTQKAVEFLKRLFKGEPKKAIEEIKKFKPRGKI